MFVVLYLWCVVNKDEVVSFWFGTKFKVRLFMYLYYDIKKHDISLVKVSV